MVDTIVCARGIGEPIESPILMAVVREVQRLRGKPVRVIHLPWSASYGPVPQPFGESFSQSLRRGFEMLDNALLAPAVGLGFSGGAKLMGDAAAQGHRNLKAVGLIADPAMPMGVVRQRTRAWGITGQRKIERTPVLWKADPKDGICLCPPNSPLRTLADQSEAFSLGDPAAWGESMFTKLRRGQFQQVDPLRQFTMGEWLEAIKLFRGYKGGDHTSYATRKEHNGKTYTQNLAAWLNQQMG
ncbi:lysin B [Gordonia phage Rabbitrun]|uniref:Lysin B n=1 Tax=Gordonia phage Rabbitrun TaxID=2762280 RepID=A0A7G8LIS9_9CAUD|nr:lysin B [Gordonia phage Rabbitrun]QNJ57151.1 lysin B [Gordonia phage Rabbitrun]